MNIEHYTWLAKNDWVIIFVPIIKNILYFSEQVASSIATDGNLTRPPVGHGGMSVSRGQAGHNEKQFDARL